MLLLKPNNYFREYNSTPHESSNIKSRVLNHAIFLKFTLSGGNQVIEQRLNNIVLEIQNKINQGNLYLDKDLHMYNQQIADISQNVDNTNSTVFLKCAIILAKHNTSSSHKINWFFVTNKTNSIDRLIKATEDGELCEEIENIIKEAQIGTYRCFLDKEQFFDVGHNIIKFLGHDVIKLHLVNKATDEYVNKNLKELTFEFNHLESVKSIANKLWRIYSKYLVLNLKNLRESQMNEIFSVLERRRDIKKLSLKIEKTVGMLNVLAFANAIDNVNLPNVTHIDLSRNNIEDDGAKAIINAITRKLPNLKHLNLSHNHIGDDGAKALADDINNGNLLNLKSLDLEGNNIKSGRTQILIRSIARNLTNLEYLNISGNNIGDDGAKAFADDINNGKIPNLKYINISCNNIGDEGAKAIINAIASKLTNITHINVSYINIQSGQAQILIRAIAKLTNLEYLKISGNNIGDDGAKALADDIDKGNLLNLKYLNISDNSIGYYGAKSIIGAIARNLNNLEYLIYEIINIGQYELQPIIDAARKLPNRTKFITKYRHDQVKFEDFMATSS